MSTPRTSLLVALGIAIALLLASRTKKGGEVVATVTDAIASTVRGIRNNNPGNIELTGDQWAGLSPTQTDGRFAQFTEMKWGVRAATRVFRNYQSKHNLRTVGEMIARWAPPSENATGSYTNAVAQRVGVDPRAVLDLTNAELCYRFLRAVFRHECGIAAEAIPEATIREGIALA